MKTILIKLADGVAIMNVAEGAEPGAEVLRWRSAYADLGYQGHQEIDPAQIPTDRTFRNAWTVTGGKIGHDLTKCKAIAHDRRRSMREAEFKPHDDVIAKQIPGKSATEAEGARQAIRDKYDAMQSAIDAAQSVEQIKAALT